MFSNIFFTLCYFSFLTANQHPETELIFRPQTPVEAFSFVEYLVNRLPFFKENDYNIALPIHSKFDLLYECVQELSEEKKNDLRQFFTTQIYDESSFDSTLSKLYDSELIIRQGLNLLSILANNWEFSLKKKYNIILTLYGPGGNYNASEAKILLAIKEKKEPSKKWIDQTILHEIVHIGIEKSIVQKYKLFHWEKERLVDLICFHHLKEILPEYKMQEKGDKKIDIFVNEYAITHDLPTAIQNFVQENPR